MTDLTVSLLRFGTIAGKKFHPQLPDKGSLTFQMLFVKVNTVCRADRLKTIE